MDRSGMLVKTLSDMRVLLVADEHDCLTCVRSALAPFYGLTTCRSPESALALLASGRSFHVLVADFRLVEMSGRELHFRVSETKPVLARNSLLIVSGRISPDDERFLDSGRFRVVYYPVRIDQLRKEVLMLAARAALFPGPRRRSAPALGLNYRGPRSDSGW